MPKRTGNDNNLTTTIVEFCAGYAGIGLGLKRFFGESMRTIGYCELEGFAQANLISKMEAGFLDEAPIWANLTAFPYKEFYGLVDIACAGIPCQPHSLAGKRKGGNDERFLFDLWFDGLEIMQPKYIFIENVEGFLSSKMPDGSLCVGYVMRRLEEIGYCVETPNKELSLGIFSAEEVGAPHRRKRVFILAHREGKRVEGLPNKHVNTEGWEKPTRHVGCCSEGWPSRPGQEQYEWEPPRVVVDPKSSGDRGILRDIPEKDASITRPEEQHENEVWEPEPTSAEKPNVESTGLLRSEKQEQQAAGVEQSDNWEIERSVGRGTTRTPDRMVYAELCESCNNRTDELRLLGNGVVPATAALAWKTLYARLSKH